MLVSLSPPSLLLCQLDIAKLLFWYLKNKNFDQKQKNNYFYNKVTTKTKITTKRVLSLFEPSLT